MSPMFVPGPVDVAPEVLAAQAKPMMPHRSKDFEEIFRRTAEKAQKLFFTQYRVFQGTSSGSGMQEAGVRNFVQEQVLSCVNGAFADRWYKCAIANGKQADKIEVAWGQAITPELLADALKQKTYEAVTIVHNETSTGVENPVKDLAKVVHELSPDTLILVDAVSSLGGTKIEMDAWGIDFLLTSSQKCLALPPGLSLAAASDRAMKKAETVSNRGWYFDLVLMEKHRLKDSTPMTPVMPLIYALDVQLDRILEEGLDNRFARHAAMAKRTQNWAIAHGMEPLAPEGYRSKTVSTIKNTKGLDIAALNKFLQTKGMRIANGYGDLKDKTYRIAHMGEITMSDVDALLAAMEEFMK
ncbi:MAG: alanine--glyoxylate aminotransferase family protein [Leptolinea sp.]|jgi:predicted phosphoserine aminotransferase|nr:alanine--glyoxylate aminotransferase family protein [Leptolinea sp.]